MITEQFKKERGWFYKSRLSGDKHKYFWGICDICGLEYKGRSKFVCSKRCARIKNPIKMLGKNNPMFGKPSPMKGKSPTLEHRQKISNALSGNKSRFWKGGITTTNKLIRASLEYKIWREAVFKRDNYTCQKYQTKGGKLHPHHIFNFSENKELRFDLNNGITLSEKAHREFHKQYGIKNNTKQQIEEFINSQPIKGGQIR